MGHRGLELAHSDSLPLDLANYVLGGGGFSSRLLQVIRAEAGQTYSIFSSFPSYGFTGYFRVNTFTRNEQLRSILDLTLDEIVRFHDEGLTSEELEAAKDNTAGSYVLGLDTLGGLSNRVLNAEFYGWGLDFVRNFKQAVRSFSLDEINNLIKKYLEPENLQIAMLGDLQVLETLPNNELLPGLSVEEVEVVSWLDTFNQPGMTYAEARAAREREQEPFEVAWNAQIDDEARALLENAIAVQGGLEGLQGLTDYYSSGQGTLSQQGLTFDVGAEQWVVPPDKVRQVIVVSPFPGQTIEVVLVWNGQRGWISQFGQVEDMSAEDLKGTRESVEFDALFGLLFIGKEDFQFAYGGTADVDGVQAEVLNITNAAGDMATVYFDPGTFYPIKTTVRDEETIWDDYRPVDGYVVSFSQTTLVGGETVASFEAQEVTINQGLSDGLFQKPE